MASKSAATGDLQCVFCKIVSGELPCVEIYQDDTTLSFMDINPVSDGHVLIIPKAHYANLYEMPDALLGHVAAAVKRVATAVERTLGPDGMSITQANGPGAAQSVLHYHCHVVPRALGDDLKINWKLKPGDLAAINETAARIRLNLDAN